MLRLAWRLRPLLAAGAAVVIVVRGDTSIPTPDVASWSVAGESAPAAPGSQVPRTLVSVGPARLLDTSGGAPVGPGATLALPILGHLGVPVVGVDAVVLSVTAVGATAPTSVSISATGGLPSGQVDAPTAAATTAVVLADVGADGSIAVSNTAGEVHVVIDVAGYVLAP